MSDEKKYFVIAGNPFTTMGGTTTFTGLSVIFKSSSKKLAKKKVKDSYDKAGGLILLIDSDGNEC